MEKERKVGGGRRERRVMRDSMEGHREKIITDKKRRGER